METLSTFDPLQLGFEQIGIPEYVGHYSRIDLFLPEDPVAGLDWENLSRGCVFRCTTRDYNGIVKLSRSCVGRAPYSGLHLTE